MSQSRGRRFLEGKNKLRKIYPENTLFTTDVFWVNTLHSLGNFDTQQAHGVLDDLRHVAGQHKAHGLLVGVGLVEYRVVVVELVEHLRQFVAVVGNARR